MSSSISLRLEAGSIRGVRCRLSYNCSGVSRSSSSCSRLKRISVRRVGQGLSSVGCCLKRRGVRRICKRLGSSSSSVIRSSLRGLSLKRSGVRRICKRLGSSSGSVIRSGLRRLRLKRSGSRVSGGSLRRSRLQSVSVGRSGQSERRRQSGVSSSRSSSLRLQVYRIRRSGESQGVSCDLSFSSSRGDSRVVVGLRSVTHNRCVRDLLSRTREGGQSIERRLSSGQRYESVSFSLSRHVCKHGSRRRL